jgi:hypothetical protein
MTSDFTMKHLSGLDDKTVISRPASSMGRDLRAQK